MLVCNWPLCISLDYSSVAKLAFNLKYYAFTQRAGNSPVGNGCPISTQLFLAADIANTFDSIPNESPPPDVLVDTIRNRLNNPDGAHESVPSVCNVLIDDLNVCHVPQHKSFSVADPVGTAHSVRLFPKESCTCPSNSSCCHILAVRKSIGMDTSRRRTICLTQLSADMMVVISWMLSTCLHVESIQGNAFHM